MRLWVKIKKSESCFIFSTKFLFSSVALLGLDLFKLNGHGSARTLKCIYDVEIVPWCNIHAEDHDTTISLRFLGPGPAASVVMNVVMHNTIFNVKTLVVHLLAISVVEYGVVERHLNMNIMMKNLMRITQQNFSLSKPTLQPSDAHHSAESQSSKPVLESNDFPPPPPPPPPPQSVLSDNDSGYSSMNTGEDPTGATDEFVFIILENENLKPAFVKICEKIDASRFDSTFVNLLKIYSKELEVEAQTYLEKLAGPFIRRHRRNAVFKIRETIYLGQSQPILALNNHQKAQKEKLLDDWLKKLTESPEAQLSEKLEEWEHDASDSEDGDDDVETPNVQKLRRFLTKGAAFDQLQESILAIAQQETDKNIPDLSEAECPSKPKTTSYLTSHGIQGQCAQWYQKLQKSLSVFFRPRLSPGLRRIEWQCVSYYHGFSCEYYDR